MTNYTRPRPRPPVPVDNSVYTYAVGLFNCSVCAPKSMSLEEVIRATPGSGTQHGWRKSSENFSGGESNPCQCNDNSERLHYLLEC